MKKALLLFVITFFGMHSLIAQNACSKYYPMTEGSSLKYDIYNKKGKKDGTTSYTVTEIKNENGRTQSKLKMTFEDVKGKNTFDSEYGMTCTDKGIKIDYMSLMSSQMLSQYKDMDIEMDITGTDIQIPNDLNIGQQLADANVNVSMDMGAMKMNVAVNTVDRTVLAQEKVTTAAGTFDCFVLSETIQSKSMGANINMTSKTWLAEGIGMIKNETYNKKGTLQSKSELASYSK